MKNLLSGNKMIVFLTALVALVIGLGIYALFYAPVSYEQAPDVNVMQNTDTNPVPTSTTSVATDLSKISWKSYTNEKFAFSMKIPETFTIDERMINNSPAQIDFIQQSPYLVLNFSIYKDSDLKNGVSSHGLNKSIYDEMGRDEYYRYTIANDTYEIGFKGCRKPEDEKLCDEIAASMKFTANATVSTHLNTELEEFVSDTGLFTALYPQSWDLSQKPDAVVFSDVGEMHDAIYIKQVNGKMVVDSDAKFGSVVYWYDAPTQMWMMDDNELTSWDGNGPSNNVRQAIPMFYTAGGHPVFQGRQRWKTNIVALDRTHFLVINITGSGFTKPLDPFVKTIVGADKRVNEAQLKAAIEELKLSTQ
jgi:hypothetical protein